MSIDEAFILEPVPLQNVPAPVTSREVWLALRPDLALGSGREDDPYDCTVQNTPILAITSLTTSAQGTDILVTITCANHGFVTGDIVIMSGIVGTRYFFLNEFPANAIFRFNGPHVVNRISSSVFTYVVNGQANPSPTLINAANAKCRLDPYRFDRVMRSLSGLTSLTVHLGPGVFSTKGYCLEMDVPTNQVAWKPNVTMRIMGAGMGVTTLKLVEAVHRSLHYYAIGVPPTNEIFAPRVAFEASDFTVDCGGGSQPDNQSTCGAIWVRGSYTRMRRIRAINFSRGGWTECFVMAAAGSELVTQLPGSSDCAACVFEDCVVEQPATNSIQETTCITFAAGDSPFAGGNGAVLGAYHRACVIRNCRVDCEYRPEVRRARPAGAFVVTPPIRIKSISTPVGVDFTCTVETLENHLLEMGDTVWISGAYVTPSGSAPPANYPYASGYDNVYVGAFTVASKISATVFTVNTDASAASAPIGEMWLGRFPSQRIAIETAVIPSALTVNPDGSTTYQMTVTTRTAHFLAPGQVGDFSVVGSEFKLVIGGDNGNVTDGSGRNRSVTGTWFMVSRVSRTEFVCQRKYDSNVSSLFIGDDLLFGDFSNSMIGPTYQGCSIANGASGVIEGCLLSNLSNGGPYIDSYNTKDYVVRNNHYRNVTRAIANSLSAFTTAFGATAPTALGGFSRVGNLATFTIGPSRPPHGFTVGQGIRITNAQDTVGLSPDGEYNGRYVIEGVDPVNNAFSYLMGKTPLDNPQLGTQPSVNVLWQIRDIVCDNNLIELAPSINTADPSSGVFLYGPIPVNVFLPADRAGIQFYVFRRVVVRNNTVRYISAPNGTSIRGNPTVDTGLNLVGCEQVVAEGNIVDSENAYPLRFGGTYSAMEYFNNGTSAGAALRAALGTNPPVPRDDLFGLVDNAAAMSFL